MKNACSRWSFLAVPVLAAFGCSDPVPLPAQGSVTLQLGGADPVVPATNCPVPDNVYPVGNPAPTSDAFGKPVVDGENGASVSCSVHGSGPYTFSGSLNASASDANKDPITITFSSGVVNSDKLTGTVTVGVSTPQLGDTFGSGSTPCTVTVINGQVKGGSIWANFSCPSLTSPPSGLCSSGVAPSVSTLLFENCDGS
jgi:hypothetical protein